MVTLSVIIPVYNAEQTLRECVDSVLAQDYTDFELILVDDGSKDSSLRMCEEFTLSDSRVKVIHKKNGGVSSARNRGIEEAQGEWIGFIDADDYIAPSYFSELPLLRGDIIIGSYKNIVNGEVEEAFEVLSCKAFDLKSFLKTNLHSSILRTPWAKFYRRSIIGDIRFPEDMKVGEDACFVWQYLARCNSIGIAKKSIYYVRLSEVEDRVKYAVSVVYAVNSLSNLHHAFKTLNNIHSIGKDKFFSFIGYFKNISKEDWREDPKKWYHNPTIKALYRYVWSDLSLLQKLRLILAIAFKR